MQFQAILSNPGHPKYSAVTIPFPLSRKEYDYFIEILEALEIGDIVKQDCKVEEITGCYPILKRLEGSIVNVDELDYLAKRLDSFWGDEGAQFQAMANKLNLVDIKDIINLTFCCQQATVITDFSNLEQVGKEHFFHLNEGCVTTEDLENLDGEETARLLIDSGAGTVTPYGVVYDNGMELEQLYAGKAFPAFLYEASPIAVIASPLSEPEGTDKITFFGLPMTEKQIQRTLIRGGIESAEQMRFELDRKSVV